MIPKKILVKDDNGEYILAELEYVDQSDGHEVIYVYKWKAFYHTFKSAEKEFEE